MLRPHFSFKNNSLPLTSPGGHGGVDLTSPGGHNRVERSLEYGAFFARQAKAGFRNRSGPRFLRQLREACRCGVCVAAPLSPRCCFSARMMARYLLQQRLAHAASKLGLIKHTICLGLFAKLRVCFHVKGNALPRFKIANLINFSNVESYIGKSPAETKGWCQSKGKFTKMF